MRCPNCGNDNADQAKFCSTCGSRIEQSAVERAQPEAPVSRLPMKTLLIATLVGAAILLVMAFVLAMLRPKAPVAQTQTMSPQPTAPLAQARVPPYAPSQPLAQTDIPPAPQAVKAPPEEKAPPEVIEYLKFLQQIDKERTETQIDWVAAMSDPKSIGRIYGDYVKRCDDLSRKFLSVNAPEPCTELKGAYYGALRQYIGVIANLQADIVRLASINSGELDDPEKIMAALTNSAAQQAAVPLAMRGKYSNTQSTIDQQFQKADAELDKVTKRYRLEKSFAIRPDSQVNSLLGR